MPQPIKIKVALQNLPHKCTRTVLVPEDIDMRQMHFIIQEAFGWLNAHLFEFSDAKMNQTISVGIPGDDEMEWFGPQQKSAHKVKLKETFLQENGGKPFWYWYDFGDDWWHRVSFLKTSKKDLTTFEAAPVCIKAEGKCPPEDVGGPWGYAEFLEIIKDKDHPEHKELREWYGLEKNESYDEYQVDLDEINRILHGFYNSKDWSSDSYEMF